MVTRVSNGGVEDIKVLYAYGVKDYSDFKLKYFAKNIIP